MRSIRRPHAIVLMISLLGALTACQGGEASPASSATTPAASATPTAGPTTPTAAVTVSPAPGTAALVLGPEGIGALKLGMTREQAEATGLVAPFEKTNPETCGWRSHLRDAPADQGWVLHSESLGVTIIDAYAGVRTAQGITLGSSEAEVRRAYPDWQIIPDTGRGNAKVPGNNKAVYRIEVGGGKVVALTLQYAEQGCYE